MSVPKDNHEINQKVKLDFSSGTCKDISNTLLRFNLLGSVLIYIRQLCLFR